MNQGFALYNYIHKEVRNRIVSKMCFFLINDLLSKYNKLVSRRLKKDPKRNDMNLNPSPTDIEVGFNEDKILEIIVPKYFELYYGFVRRCINDSISKWFIECKVKGMVIK